MLGDEQHAWLRDGFAAATTRWTGWANEVLSLPFRVGVGPLAVQPLVDSWDGYPAERERLFATMRDNDATAFVTLTGDLHSTVVGDQRVGGERVGLEVMTPAVTSVNVAEAVNLDEGLRGRLTRPLLAGAVTAANPHIDRFDSHDWGYTVTTFERDRVTAEVYAVDKTVNAADAPRSRLARVERARDDLLG
jgi:alkaline phosphatase D